MSQLTKPTIDTNISPTFGPIPSNIDDQMQQPPGSRERDARNVSRLYDAYRTSTLNAKYNGQWLSVLQWRSRVMEISIAIGTSGTIASLVIWHTTIGKVIFGLLVAFAAILGVLKPILNYSQMIERYSKLWAEYNTISNRLRRVVEETQIEHEVRTDITDILDRMDQLSDDPMPNRKRLRQIQNEVEEEIDAERLWWPPL